MSLFSSFDTYVFFGSYLIFFLLMIFGIFFNQMFFLNIFEKYFYSGLKFFNSFFGSLNNFNFSKSLDFMIFLVMVFIFFLNFSSIFPSVFAFNSQPSLVMWLSLSFWLSLFTFSLVNNFKGQISHFIPDGAPTLLSIFLFLIELVSMIIRPFTLMVRLVANILAGHLLVILLSNLILNFSPVFISLSLLNFVEIFVSFIQAYIFCTLLSLFYSEIYWLAKLMIILFLIPVLDLSWWD